MVRTALAEVLTKYRSLPWWAVGQAQLARFFISDEGDLPHAYKLAMEGWRDQASLDAHLALPSIKALLS